MPITRDTAAFSAAQYGIELEGRFAGWVGSAAGGDAYGVLAKEVTGPDHAEVRRISEVKYEEIEIEFSSGMSPDFYDWLGQALAQEFTRKNGAVLTLNANRQIVSRLEFSDGSISAIG